MPRSRKMSHNGDIPTQAVQALKQDSCCFQALNQLRDLRGESSYRKAPSSVCGLLSNTDLGDIEVE